LNDADQELANCYKQIQHHEAEVLRWLPRVNSRQLFREWKTHTHLTDIQRAARYLYLNALSFGADGQSWGVQKESGGGAASSQDKLKEKVKAFTSRLDRVIVESLDWKRCIALYDGPGTLFFCDPPYTTGSQKSYTCFTAEQAEELAATMRSIQGQMILTLNDTPENRQRFKGLIAQRITTSASIRANSKRFGEFIAATPLRK
jgi:DNA adenine methylase